MLGWRVCSWPQSVRWVRAVRFSWRFHPREFPFGRLNRWASRCRRESPGARSLMRPIPPSSPSLTRSAAGPPSHGLRRSATRWISPGSQRRSRRADWSPSRASFARCPTCRTPVQNRFANGRSRSPVGRLRSRSPRRYRLTLWSEREFDSSGGMRGRSSRGHATVGRDHGHW